MVRMKGKFGDRVLAGLGLQRIRAERGRLRGSVIFDAFYPDFSPKWSMRNDNLIVNVGLDHDLDVTLSAGSQITTWYILLINAAGPTLAAADTMASHAGWAENQNYSEGVRQTWTDGGVSSQSVTNSASPATFSIDTNSQTIGGVALTSVSTKGGTSGTLFSEVAFTSAKALDDGETLQVTYTFTMADDGV